jgi:urease accessory protein
MHLPRPKTTNYAAPAWVARLTMSFSPDSDNPDKTLLDSQHLGPLRIQKALYPEGNHPCHAVIIHPPGGIAAGDHLTVEIHTQANAQALITTPGATKWYGSGESNHYGAQDQSRYAEQNITLDVGGTLEWLPQETIVFNRAQARSVIDITISDEARMIGWETLIFGRKASGESFCDGGFEQSIRCRSNDSLIWQERTKLKGSDPLFHSPIGLRGYHSFSTCWAIQPRQSPWREESISELREHCSSIAWTQLSPRLVIGRALGDPLALRAALHNAWRVLRPLVAQRPAVSPRLWAT